MEFDAVVLAGGRSARLGGTAKALLEIAGRSLLDLTLDAVTDARRTVVVGDVTVRPGVLLTRENPAFGGPVAATAAGLARLAPGAEHTLVLACDMPLIATVITALREAGGGIAVDDGREQYLAALLPTAELRAATAGPVDGIAMRTVLAAIDPIARVPVPTGSTRDIDTWTDAELFGAHA
ncbi:molybdenum cofactor guanylyltransferase [Lacisediminihabitans changchengi]|uniref:NTP transferase domain-containing protein n=1 Tax=Lacisediminihabitans changchengi TaxID=2787634 RepID=A0A934W2G6_9MICO|nr:NTP transferase domain-containing protein [Lacisediminihabitans changchengi]MBK4346801.1 NTP transferase domain-containing protein [Lacisediminihabitans changchengi]MBK4348076.1 NTP transferase domain-containing protein [Lacisediminihabitans changchengi]